MRIDRYAKVILTMIAACLVWLSLGGVQLVPSALAQGPEPLSKKPFPTVISASDFGFRMDSWRLGEAPIGTLVVQINGTWYEARLHYAKP
jgi:hypothetical protein